MRESKKIISIGTGRLIGHPANPNRMSAATLGKLKSHIERTGNYEPIIVRPHPERSDCFEILNGHHRLKVLKELDYERADCVVWDVGDSEALLLLATLNSLSGSEDVYKKSELIRNLSREYSAKELSGKLVDNAKSIQRLLNLKAGGHRVFTKAFLNPVTFFLTDEQKHILDEALTAAAEMEKGETIAQRRALGIVTMARSFMKATSKEKEKRWERNARV